MHAALAHSADPRGVCSICPASDGGYTLLALPDGADEAACFDGVKWSSDDTCLSQLAALSRAGLLCTIGRTHADVDELDDLKALAQRLLARPEAAAGGKESRDGECGAGCPRTAKLLGEVL